LVPPDPLEPLGDALDPEGPDGPEAPGKFEVVLIDGPPSSRPRAVAT
jgi:hypothetical protein